MICAASRCQRYMGSISMHAHTLGMCSPRGEERVKLAGLDAVLLEGRRTAASSGAEASLKEGRLRTRMMAVVVERSRAYKWTVPEADWGVPYVFVAVLWQSISDFLSMVMVSKTSAVKDQARPSRPASRPHPSAQPCGACCRPAAGGYRGASTYGWFSSTATTELARCVLDCNTLC